MTHPEAWPLAIEDLILVLTVLGFIGTAILWRQAAGWARWAWGAVLLGWTFHLVGEVLWQFLDIDLLAQRWLRVPSFRGSLVVGIWIMVWRGWRR